MCGRLNIVSARWPFTASPIHLDTAIPKSFDTAVDLADVKGSYGVIEGHFLRVSYRPNEKPTRDRVGLTRVAGKPSPRHTGGMSTARKVSMPGAYLGCRSIIWSQRIRNWPHHLPRGLVLALTLIRDRPQKAALCPGQVCDFHDHFRPDSMNF